MTAEELYNVASVMGLVVSAAVAAFVFPLWRRYHLPFLLVFGFSALLDIFIILMDFVLLGRSSAEYASAAKLVQSLHITSMLIFGVGLLLLVRFVRSAGITGPPPDAMPSEIAALAFCPRGDSKVVFVIAMSCYAVAANYLLRMIFWAAGAPQASVGTLAERGHPAFDIIALLLLAPVIESLLLIGMIELMRRLRVPSSVQVVVSAVVFALLHSLEGVGGLAVAPGWAIMAIAYLAWRHVSWRVGFAVVASIHALLNLIPAISTLGYATRNI